MSHTTVSGRPDDTHNRRCSDGRGRAERELVGPVSMRSTQPRVVTANSSRGRSDLGSPRSSVLPGEATLGGDYCGDPPSTGPLCAASGIPLKLSGVALRRGQSWDEEAIRAGLTAFLPGWEVWPTCEEFAVGGAKGLREAVTRIHGAEWWAREMGLPGGERPPGGVRRWTDEAIRATLAQFLGERTTWPSNREFDAADLHGLREALRHYGGPKRWSAEMGVRWTPRAPFAKSPKRSQPTEPPARSREWPRWNERTIAVELKAFVAGRSDWPRHAEFVETGRKGLYQAVLSHGGSEIWAQRIGVTRVKRYGGNPPYWPEERVRERLAKLLGGRVEWPSTAEFVAASEVGLLNAVRRLGGIKRWADEFGLPYVRRANGGSSGTRAPITSWDADRIAAAISPLIEELGRWPTKGEFRRAGQSKALAAVYEHGGSAAWRQRFGVAPRRLDGPVPDRRWWSEERLETELRDFCRGRKTWPTFRDFQDADRYALYRAACRYGGMQYWRERLALGTSTEG